MNLRMVKSKTEISAEEQSGLSHSALRQQLEHCPFCARRPDFEPWHGGAPTKVYISCTARWEGECVVPSTTGETWAEGKRNWNMRRRPRR